MAGERKNRLSDLAVQGATRLARRMEMVHDRFNDAVNDEQGLFWQDMMAELDEFGHTFEMGCQHPRCVHVRQVMQQAIATVQQQGAQP